MSKYSEALTAAEDEIESKSPIFTLEQFKRFQEAYSDSVIEMIGITFDNDEVIEGEEYDVMLFELIKAKLNVTN